MSTLPWLCIGDFNEIQCDEEKVGGVRKNWKLLAEFREAMDESGLVDMGFLGSI